MRAVCSQIKVLANVSGKKVEPTIIAGDFNTQVVVLVDARSHEVVGQTPPAQWLIEWCDFHSSVIANQVECSMARESWTFQRGHQSQTAGLHSPGSTPAQIGHIHWHRSQFCQRIRS